MSVVRFRPEAPFFHGAIGRHEKIMLPEGESKGGSWKQSGGLFQPPWLFRRKAIPPGGCHIEGMQPSAPPLPPRHCLSSDSARRPSRRRDAIFCIVPLFAALFPLRSRSARNLIFAAVAHLVERHLAKVEVASSSLVSRSKLFMERFRFRAATRCGATAALHPIEVRGPRKNVFLWGAIASSSLVSRSISLVP